MAPRHKVFISYHHANDEAWKADFVRRFQHLFVDWSVRLGDVPDGLPTETVRQRIREKHLGDSTVTVVLCGTHTWQRKHVDWEISSSLRDTPSNPRSGVLGVLLPSRADYKRDWDKFTTPPRLVDNFGGTAAFAGLIWWTDDAAAVSDAIHKAFVRRDQSPPPDNSRVLFANNRAGERWLP